MSNSERSPRETEPLPGVTRSRQAKSQPGSDGFLDEPDFDSLTSTRMGGAHHEDSRTLGELADSVTAAASEEDSQASEDSTEEDSQAPEDSTEEDSQASEDSTRERERQDEAPPESADSPPDEPVDTSKTRSRGRWAAGGVVALLLFAVGALALGPALDTGRSSPNSEASTETRAAPSEGSGTPPAGDESPVAVVADSTPSPVPTPETVAAAPAPAVNPAPTPTVVPAPTPTVVPATTPTVTPAPIAIVAPAPDSVHVGDLIPLVEQLGQGTKVKVSIDVYVHDSAHSPTASATVSGHWTGTSGSISCTTDATSFCTVQTGPISVPGSVTFTVTGITYNGLNYQPAHNHDAGGDSNGTSITVTF